jgi:hypothetical protein
MVEALDPIVDMIEAMQEDVGFTFILSVYKEGEDDEDESITPTFIMNETMIYPRFAHAEEEAGLHFEQWLNSQPEENEEFFAKIELMEAYPLLNNRQQPIVTPSELLFTYYLNKYKAMW